MDQDNARLVCNFVYIYKQKLRDANATEQVSACTLMLIVVDDYVCVLFLRL
jgi:hypothetical protein